MLNSSFENDREKTTTEKSQYASSELRTSDFTKNRYNNSQKTKNK
jgi:hypothetical protein